MCVTLFNLFSVSSIPEPEFLEEIGNTTVPAGRNIKLACSVKDLGTYKVMTVIIFHFNFLKIISRC